MKCKTRKRESETDFLKRIPEEWHRLTIKQLRMKAVDLHYQDGDHDAIALSFRLVREMLDEAKPFNKKSLMKDILTPEHFQGFIILNHMQAYLEDRQGYVETGHIQARGYITVT